MKQSFLKPIFVVLAFSVSYFTYNYFSKVTSSLEQSSTQQTEKTIQAPTKITPNISGYRRNKIGDTAHKRKNPHTLPSSTNNTNTKQPATDKSAQPITTPVSKTKNNTQNIEQADSQKENTDVAIIKKVAIKSVASPTASTVSSTPIIQTRSMPLKNEVLNPLVKEALSTTIFDKSSFAIYVDAKDANKGKKITGELVIYDNKRLKKINTIETHTLTGINDPKNGDKSIRLACSIFGYRPQTITLSLTAPNAAVTENNSTVETINDSIIKVNLKLERLQVGDLAVMWKVYFFRDAAIMRPESQPQLNELANMMIENANMKIKLHGHTNGNSHGKIIHLGDNDNSDLFNINSTKHVETAGSAQKLSLFRAETIQHYLLTQGIDMSRIEIKGWGGKKMLHDKHDSQAKLNVRVEIEILEN